MDDLSSAKDALEFLEKKWARPSGLALALITILILCATSSAFVPKDWVGGAFAVGVAATIMLWLCNRRLPKCPSGRVGFVIAIHCDTDEIRTTFRSDFIQHLKALLSEGESADRFWVHELSAQRNIELTTLQEANELREKMNASFVLFGRVRSRGQDKKQHIVDLRGLVSHAPLDEKNRKQLEKEFTELLPRRLIASAGSELPGFELGSSLAELTARYIIGIASECSGDFDYATRLFADAYKRAQSLFSAAPPIVKKIADRIPFRLSEIAIARARYAYNSWRDSKSDEELNNVYDHLVNAPLPAQGMLEWRTLMAICEVLRNANYKAAKGLIAAYSSKDSVSRMNLAFLDSVGKNLKAAVKSYRAAAKMGVELSTAEEVMDFLELYRDRRPALYAEMSFDLGFIAYAVLEDEHLASQYFKEFVSADADGKYAEQQQLIPKWLGELKAK